MLAVQILMVFAKLSPCRRTVGECLSESIVLGSATLIRILRETSHLFKNAGHVGRKDAT